MKVFGILAKSVVPALLLSAVAHGEDRFPVPSEPVLIKKISYNGSGCPEGTVAENVSEDKKSFTLTFSEFVAEAGPDISLSAGRKNCIATIVLDVPAGWQYSVGTFNYRGYMGLDEGITAVHSTTYFLEGSDGRQGRFAATRKGPLSEDFVFTDKIGLDTVFIPQVWSECNTERALNINTAIRVSNQNSRQYPNARGLITNDSIDGKLQQKFGLTWRNCK